MDMGFFLQKERIFPGAHKIGATISSPRIADKHFTDTRIFPKGPNLEKIQDRLKISISLEIFNLA